MCLKLKVYTVRLILILITNQAVLAKDVKNELETALGVLSGKGKGVKGKGPRGAERRKMWDEVKALRKE
jgi:DNA polymerase alpha-associated DNA helicase A